MTTQRYNPTTGTFTVVVDQLNTAKSETAKVIANGDILFNVTGDVVITNIISECYTANDATASTLQYQVVTGAASPATQTITNASASLANAAVGTVVAALSFPNLTTIPSVAANGVLPGIQDNIGVRTSGGTIRAVVGVGSTTGTWKHYVYYRQLEPHAQIVAAF